jgi:hypothetical protein
MILVGPLVQFRIARHKAVGKCLLQNNHGMTMTQKTELVDNELESLLDRLNTQDFTKHYSLQVLE